MKDNTQEQEKRVTFLQYLNTVLLSVISIVLIFLCNAVIVVKENQEKAAVEVATMKTKLDVNIGTTANLENRVRTIEFNNTEVLKNWVDQNYVRKSQ